VDTFLTASGALALVTAFVNFLKYIKAKDTNGWVTQLIVWIAGVGSVLLVRASDFADTFNLGGTVTLDTANAGTVILAGLGLGSAAALVNEAKKALDNGDSAAKPDLVGPAAKPQP
jgi:hypothetical protein